MPTKVAKAFHKNSIPKGTLLLREGAYCQELWFLEAGSVHVFTKQGEDEYQTTQLLLAPILFTEVSKYGKQQASTKYYQALSDSNVYSLDFEALEQMYEEVPGLDEWVAQYFKDQTLFEQTEMLKLEVDSAEDNFKRWANGFGKIFHELPTTLLASYFRTSKAEIVRRKNQFQLT